MDATRTVVSIADSEPSYVIGLANDSFDWYKKHAIRARRAYRLAETALVVVGAAIPTTAALVPGSNVAPAILGAVVVVISGLRGVFHWQDNYLRFSQAREAVEAERRRYNTFSRPYADAKTRDRILAAAITKIESDEMRSWVELASKRPSGTSRPDDESTPPAE